jgi:ATP-dependent DNA helicase PIF1
LAQLLKNTDCIIWDEIPMQHRFCQEAVDRTLHDICNCDKPMGGITTVDGGDFQQILPVIVRGGQSEIVEACIKYSYLWHETTVLHLTENKQLKGGTPEDLQFADWLLKVGWGQNNDDLGLLELPRSMDCGEHIEDLIKSIYPDINQLNPHNNNDEFFQYRTILSARNADVDAVNAQILREMQGDIHTLQGSDTDDISQSGFQSWRMQWNTCYLDKDKT